jgi:hypothetical protein
LIKEIYSVPDPGAGVYDGFSTIADGSKVADPRPIGFPHRPIDRIMAKNEPKQLKTGPKEAPQFNSPSAMWMPLVWRLLCQRGNSEKVTFIKPQF